MGSNSRAFVRSQMVMDSIIAIMQSINSPILAQIAINDLPAYRSRGHGGGHKANRSRPYFGRSGWPRKRRNYSGSGVTKSEARFQAGGHWPSIPRPMWFVGNRHALFDTGFSRRIDALISMSKMPWVSRAGYSVVLD